MTILNFSILTLFIAIISCILAIGTLSKGDKEGRYLAVCLFLSAGIEISYLISILISNKFTMSLFSSIYFGLIDVMLAALVYYVMLIMEVAHCRMCRFGMTLIAIYTCFDIAVLMINPWKEIAIGYRYSEVSIQHWRYVPGTLYDMHLAFSYILIGIVFAMLIYKTIKTPSAYKSRYGGICAVLVVVVVINAIFLYTFNDQLPDISLFLYGIVSFVLYRNRYHYSKKRLFNQAYVGIIEEMSHPILLFDYEKNLVLNNGAAEYICEGLRKDDNGDVTLGDFIKECGFNEVTEFTENDVAFSWVDRRKGKEKSYRCDYHPFKDKKGHITGYLFIFTDNSTVIDVLTGFTNMNEFVRHVNGYTDPSPIPVCVTACDINNLHGINMEMGEVAGDLFIKKLADLMREKFPEGTYFVRLNEANLLAVTLGVSDEIIDVAIADIRKILLEEDNITIQTAKAVARGGKRCA